MSEIYLIRHAQASFEDENYDRLSVLGIRQAQILGEYFTRLKLTFDRAYCGSMRRQIDTAEAVLARMPASQGLVTLQRRPAFDEYDFNAILKSQIPLMIRAEPSLAEMLACMRSDRRAFQEIFRRVLMRWISGRHDARGGETWTDYVARVQGGMRAVMSENGPHTRAAVFTSGGCIAVALQMGLDISDAKTIELSWQVHNASVSIIKYGSRGMGLACFNSAAHFEIRDEADLLTYR